MHRFFKVLSRVAVVGVLAAVPSWGAKAAVSLVFTDNDATPTSTQINPGITSSFPVTVNLTSSTTTNQTDIVTGVDYFLQITGPAGGTTGQFTIQNRDLTSSAFPEFIKSNATVTATPDNMLNPQNGQTLGGVVTNQSGATNSVGGPVAGGTFNVANYTIGVAHNTPNGVYTLGIFTQPGLGYQQNQNSNPPFADTLFNSTGTFTVTVVPEPSTAMLLGAGVIGLVLRRRRA